MIIDDFIVSEYDPIIDVIKVIDKNSKGIAFVCNENQLLAVVTDGDIRRYILKNGDLEYPVRSIANYTPKYIFNDVVIDYKSFMKEHFITALPVVNKKMKLLFIRFLYDNRGIKCRSECTCCHYGRGKRN